MSDDDKKTDEVVEKVEEAAEAAPEAVVEAKEAVEEVKEVVKEVKEVKDLSSEASAKEEEKAESKKADVKVSKKLESIISNIENLSVLELSELVKALEKKFGVSAAAPVATTTAGGAIAGANEGVSEQTTFNVILTDSGATKISVIKAVREIVPTLGLKEAKDLVDAAPKPVLEGANKDTATEAKTKLEAAGAKVELK